MKKKLHLAIIFGGRSAEHSISLRSAKHIIQFSNQQKYDISLIGITQSGQWQHFDLKEKLIEIKNTGNLTLNNPKGNLSIELNLDGHFFDRTNDLTIKPEIIFPILHGTFGEDGTIQGLFQMMNLPFVGPSVLGSAMAMDKDVMKRLIRDAGIPVCKFLTITKGIPAPSFSKIKEKLGMPCFVKPANLGSSVGINKANNQEQLEAAIKVAFQYDNKVLVEAYIQGREIELAILGNHNPKVSIPGEIISHDTFYSFDAKYIDQQASETRIPAKFSSTKKIQEIQELALRTFKVLNCQGMGRVDIFVTKDERFFVNELNTIPGFTSISMYPMLWEKSGISNEQLIDLLIFYALERFELNSKLVRKI